MKFDILIVDLALVAAVFVPYILFILIGRKEIQKLKNKFLEEAKKHELRLDEKENWNNNIIGLDKGKAKILLVQKRRTGFASDLVDLKDLRSCEIHKEVLSVKIGNRNEEILQRLDLHLKLYNGTVRSLNLFNCEETYIQDYEVQHAERWQNIISSQIAFRPTINSAA
ncbi:MAG: hypothetical protein R3218_08380 [Christiangramia sp.]|nr:hypothetical protein [Christiangramia sp.]